MILTGSMKNAAIAITTTTVANRKLRLLKGAVALYLTASLTCPVDAYFGVIMTQMDGQTRYLPSVSSVFGPALPVLGVSGILYSSPHDSCDLERTTNDLAEFRRSQTYTESIIKEIIVLVTRGNCSFDTKVHNIQLGRSVSAVIVHQQAGKVNNNTDVYADFPNDISSYVGLLRMTGSKYANHIKIPSVFVSFDAGMRLREYAFNPIVTDNDSQRPAPLPLYLYALGSGDSVYKNGHSTSGSEYEDEDGDTGDWLDGFEYASFHGSGRMRRLYDVFFVSDLIMMFMVGVTTTSLCGLLTVAALVLARFRMYRNRRQWELRNRITADELRLIKERQVAAGDLCIGSGEHCAICLDEFAVEDTIRELPCRHLFHSACVDDWLLQRHRSCPTCRQEAVPRQAAACIAVLPTSAAAPRTTTTTAVASTSSNGRPSASLTIRRESSSNLSPPLVTQTVQSHIRLPGEADAGDEDTERNSNSTSSSPLMGREQHERRVVRAGGSVGGLAEAELCE